MPAEQTLAIRNLTGSGAGRIFSEVGSEAKLVSGATKKVGLPRRLGLSGKLLLLTIPLVMIAEVLIYVPAIANFRINRLNDRLAAANTAALVLDARAVRDGARYAGPADPRQHRRACSRDQDGHAAPPAGQCRPAAQNRPRHRHAQHDGMVGT